MQSREQKQKAKHVCEKFGYNPKQVVVINSQLQSWKWWKYNIFGPTITRDQIGSYRSSTLPYIAKIKIDRDNQKQIAFGIVECRAMNIHINMTSTGNSFGYRSNATIFGKNLKGTAGGAPSCTNGDTITLLFDVKNATLKCLINDSEFTIATNIKTMFAFRFGISFLGSLPNKITVIQPGFPNVEQRKR